MGTQPGIRSSLASYSRAGSSANVFTLPEREAPWRSTVLSPPSLRAFADGFGGGLIGGIVYCLVMVCFHPVELEFAWLRVLALSLTFGGFEMWRVTRRRTLRNVGTYMLLTLTVSLFVLWVLGAVIPSTDSSRRETPPHSKQSRLA